jgi:hypothetical protein
VFLINLGWVAAGATYGRIPSSSPSLETSGHSRAFELRTTAETNIRGSINYLILFSASYNTPQYPRTKGHVYARTCTYMHIHARTCTIHAPYMQRTRYMRIHARYIHIYANTCAYMHIHAPYMPHIPYMHTHVTYMYIQACAKGHKPS